MSNKKSRIVPPRRFPQFNTSEAWNEPTLGELSDRVVDKVGSEKYTTLSISAGVGFVSQTEKFDRDISGEQYRNYIHVKKGDFSYNKGNSKKFPQGCVYELNEYEEAAVPNAFISFRFHDDVVSGFYKGYFEGNFHGRQLSKHITSGARSNGLLNISADDFFSIILPTPKDIKEQQMIADCVKSLEDTIGAEHQKLESLQKYKVGLIQQLFPSKDTQLPNWRFPEYKNAGKWKFAKLIDVADRITLRNKNNAIKRVFTNSAINGVIEQNEYFEREIVSENNLTNYLVVEAGDYVYNPRISATAPVGPVSKSKIGNGIISPLYTVFRFKEEDFDFYEYYFKSTLWHQYINMKSNTGARHDRINISTDDFMNMPVPVCSDPNEKEKIALFLKNLDNIISHQEQKIELLKSYKKGLIQQLFPSFEEVFK